MDKKLLELSDLLYTIQDMQEKIQLQIADLKQDYFSFTEVSPDLYNRAKITCSIANDYSNNICYVIEEAQAAVESLITESANAQKGGAA